MPGSRRTREKGAKAEREAEGLLYALGYRNVSLVVGDGTLGCVERSPFDGIMVTAAAARYPPALFTQLGEGGLLVIPLGGRDYQTLQVIRKVAGRPQAMDLSACRFVPLVGEGGWSE